MTYHYDKGNVLVRDSVPSDPGKMAPRMRESDKQEVEASHGHTPYEALVHSFRVSPACFTVVYKNEVVAMFGVTADKRMNGLASIWFLSTDDIVKMKKTWLKLSKSTIQSMLITFPILYNFVQVGNEASIKWLKWLGAEFGDPSPYGKQGFPFLPFKFTRKLESSNV